MANFTLIKSQFNSGASDASPVWTDILFSTANHELRICAAGAGGASIASANWPIYPRPSAISTIPEMWGYTGSDNSGGAKLTTYDGTSAHYMQWRVNWDATGTFASANVLSAWKDNTLPAASPGTQPNPLVGGDGSSFVNGSAETSNTSYIKINAYGSGITAAGAQETPAANAAGTLAVTSGTAGAATPAAASWLATWQSAQANVQYIQGPAVPKTLTAGVWYTTFSFWTGPNQTGGICIPVIGMQYQWA